ncbi:HlyD family efflux transporter periplasmic adaptor subunit [Microvirga sp. GCM10011540]|uniref:HlyD family efflux transporter periplasmic adaptor subunit n=1 Tax=Microvirga sp. GCM10011540 TaxID=3317338 RepID=UPI0036237F7A
MGTANIIAMVAQPVHASYLCFEVGGILDTCRAQLGAAVNVIPYDQFSGTVKNGGTIAGDPSRLQFDSDGIVNFAQNFSLATLRNEDRKALLDKAVNTRQNVYFSRHANSASVISTIRGNYSKTSPASTPNLLEILSDIAQQQSMDLQEAYREDDRLGVVKATSSSFETTTTSTGRAQRIGKFYQESVARTFSQTSRIPAEPWEGADPYKDKPIWNSYYKKAAYTSVPSGTLPVQTTGVNYEMSNNDGTARATQSSTHVDYEYRTPFLEARARNLRAQISLRDQKFEFFMFGQTVPHLEQIFENELASLDSDVYQLQIALLRSFLTSPVPGIVTGIYKNPGDAVSAGEPVVRVEDNAVIHLVANLVHYGPIPVGATATVTTTLNGSAGGTTKLTGSVVAARGAGSGGRWEVIIKVDNLDSGGNFIVPLGYSFDAEYTVMTVV